MGSGVAVGCGVAAGMGVADGAGAAVGVGVDVGAGAGTDAGVGVGVAVGNGVGVGVGVGVAVGVGVGGGPTRMELEPPVARSALLTSFSTPANSWRPSSRAAVTVYVTRSSPSRTKLMVCPATVTAASGSSDPAYWNPGGSVSTICPKAP